MRNQFAATSDTGFSPAITSASATTTPIHSNKSRKHKNTADKHQKIPNQELAKAKSGKATTTTTSNKSHGDNENSRSLTWSKRKSEKEKGEQINKLEPMSSIETSLSPIKSKIKATINGCYSYENGNNNNTTTDQTKNSSIVTSSKSKGGKFSNLFSKKKKTSESTTLIDSTKDNGYSSTVEGSKSNSNSLFAVSKTNQHQIPPTKINELENLNQAYLHQQIDKKQINSAGEEQQITPNKNYYNKENDKEQVIEFKFDLIVNKEEKDENETTTTNLPTKSKPGKKKQSNCYNLCDHTDYDDVNYTNANSDKLGEKSKLMNDCKLNDSVNELVESFVLDSSDVCFISTGKQSDRKLANLNNTNKIAHHTMEGNHHSDEFDYLNELLLHTLTYSFELLEVKKRRLNTGIRLGNVNNHTSDDNDADDELANFLTNNTELNFQDSLTNEHQSKSSSSSKSYSIEISATLFLKLNQQHVETKQTETGNHQPANSSADGCCYYYDADNDDHKQQTPTYEVGFDYHIVDLLSNEENFSKQMNELLSSFEFNRKKQNLDEYLAKLNCDSKTATEHHHFFEDPQEESKNKHFVNKFDKNNNLAYKIDEQNSVDSVNIEEGLKLVERIKNRLKQLELNLNLKGEQQETTSCECDLSNENENEKFIPKQTINNKLLIIGFKLKEKIDSGGSFSNRMCLIDFDPNLTEMYPIFESIFNGQALAYLKRHKVHLKKVESTFNNYILNLNFHDTCFIMDDNDLEKQHHQVASRSKLIQAEWILYKQLSSALIRTLMIVHVHRLTNLPSSTSSSINTNINFLSNKHKNDREYYENYLMRENLIVLKFARSIQRASTIRLKRRKRHLKSHLASSNISIASNASETTTTNDILNLFMNHRANFDPHTTTTTTNPHFYQNEPRQLIGVNSPTNLEAIRNHSGSRRRMHSDRNRQQHYFGSQDKYNNRYYVEPISQIKAFQYNNHHQQQQPDILATESSSMSTSSGSQTRQIQSSRSSRRRDFEFKDNSPKNFNDQNNNNNNINNFSDSDSITSANLNSCSSSSFNRLQHSSLSHHRNDHNNYHHHHHHTHYNHHRSSSKQRLRRDIELRWIAKQSLSRTMMQEQQLLFNNNNNNRTTQQSRTRIELSDFKVSPTHRRSSSVSRVMTPSQVIQIDCSPTTTTSTIDNNLSSLSSQHLQEQNVHSTNVSCRTINGDNTILQGIDDNTDNVSDICSIVAEPPKQLKLEEFLNQLSSIIQAPSKITGIIQDNRSSNNSSDQDTTFTDCFANKKTNLQGKVRINNSSCLEDHSNSIEMNCKNKGITHSNRDLNDTIYLDGRSYPAHANRNTTNDTAANEDDDDCKSHSSILEQLSSLALESNSRLNNRNQHQSNNSALENEQVLHQSNFSDCHKESQEHFVSQPLDCTMILETTSTTNSDKFSTNNNDDNKRIESKGFQQISKIPTTSGGHLQKLIYNSSPRKITQPRVSVKDPSSVEEQLKALSISCQAPSSSPSTSSSGAFTLSTDSSCSSPLSSATSAENNNNNNRSTNSSRNLAKPLINQPSTLNGQCLYASVTRGRQSVKSELC